MIDLYETLKVLEVKDEPVDVAAAYARFNQKAARATARKWRPALLNPGRMRWAVATVVVVAGMALSPVRSLGQHFLALLRVQKLAVVAVGDGVLGEGARTPGKLLTQLISDSFRMTLKPGPSVKVSDLTVARQYVNFPVEQLSGIGSLSEAAVEDQGAFQFTLSVDRMRAVVEEAGRSDVRIPASVDGSTVAVHVSKGIRAEYGNCESAEAGCIHFLQVPVPDIRVPEGLDIAGLAEAGLQLTGLTAAEAHHLASTVHWTSTLVVPVPQGQATYVTVPVDGVSGLLIEWKSKRRGTAGSYELLWVKNGVIRALEGRGSSSRALAAAAEPIL